MILSPVINIAFYGFAFFWIQNMEKNSCTCSQDWRRDYMKYFFLAVIGIQFLIMGKGISSLKKYKIPLGIASLVYLYASLTYIHTLREQSCGCSDSMERSILFWYSAIQIISLIIMVSIY